MPEEEEVVDERSWNKRFHQTRISPLVLEGRRRDFEDHRRPELGWLGFSFGLHSFLVRGAFLILSHVLGCRSLQAVPEGMDRRTDCSAVAEKRGCPGGV